MACGVLLTFMMKPDAPFDDKLKPAAAPSLRAGRDAAAFPLVDKH
jgi:hypothetical protein